MHVRWIPIAGCLVWLLCGSAKGATPADDALAQEHERLGRAQTVAGRYEDALGEYQLAWQLAHRDVDLLNVARLRARIGRLVESDAAFAEWESLPTRDRALETHARDEHAAVVAKICTLRLRGPVDVFRIDGAVAHSPARVNPGERQIEARLGEHVTTRMVRCPEGGAVELELGLDRPAAHAQHVRGRRPPWMSLLIGGAGVALLGAGGITGGLGLDRYASLSDTCGAMGTCDPSSVRGVRGELAAADVLVGTGILAVAAALIVYLTVDR